MNIELSEIERKILENQEDLALGIIDLYAHNGGGTQKTIEGIFEVLTKVNKMLTDDAFAKCNIALGRHKEND